MQQRYYIFLLFVILFSLKIDNIKAQDSAIIKYFDTLLYQRDMIDVVNRIFFKKISKRSLTYSPRSNKKFYFSLLPAATSVPGGGRAFITSTNVSFYLGDRKTTTLSVADFTPYTNFQDRYGLPLRSNIWLKNNSWNLLGDLRILVYPQSSWGLGGNTPISNETLINYNYFRFYETALKKIAPFLYAGIGVNVDRHSSILSEKNNGFSNSIKPYYDSLETTTNSTGLHFTLQYDSRNNTNNANKGIYASLNFRLNPTFLPNTGKWSQWFLDFRRYYSFSNTKQKVLAFWTYYWVTKGAYIPYLDLPSTQWDSYSRSGRGFQQSRYRSDQLAYAETEYRQDITKNGLLGFVVFTNIEAVTEFKTNQFKYWHPAIGTGLRIKLNKFARTNIVLDYALSKEYNTFYLNISETF